MRWSYRTCSIRMLHTIVELKGDFVRRDRPFQRRQDLDAAARNWFWQEAALKFNDPAFLPAPASVEGEERPPSSRFLSADVLNNVIFKQHNFCPEFTGYLADPNKIQSEFNELRTTVVDLLGK